MSKILIVDKDLVFKQLATSWLKNVGHDVETIEGLKKGLKKLDTFQPEIVILALRLPQTELSEDIIKEYLFSPVSPRVIITGDNINPNLVAGILQIGVYDCFETPLKINGAFTGTEKLQERLLTTVSRAGSSVQKAISLVENIKRDDIIGSSSAIIYCLANLKKAAMTERPILITGETGTGKELFAKAAHENSSRFGKNLVLLDCGALPETIIQGELFGYKKGSHDKAYKDKAGLIKKADGGTLFLDEIGNLTLSIQAKLLRAVEQKTFYPLGATEPEHSDFRLVSATNEDIEKEIIEGSFRADLYNRINTFVIHLPPLRNRKEDIKELASHFIARTCSELKIKQKECTQEFIKALEMHEWKYNVRELKNVIYRTVALNRDIQILTPDILPPEIRGPWIVSAGLKVHQPSNKEMSQLYDEMISSLKNDIGQKENQRLLYEMDYETGIPMWFDFSSTENVPIDSPTISESSGEISPEKVIAGDVKWDRIKSLDYNIQVSIMVVARSLWKKRKKELATILGVRPNTLDKFFSDAKKYARNGKFQFEDLKDFVYDKHHPVLFKFFKCL